MMTAMKTAMMTASFFNRQNEQLDYAENIKSDAELDALIPRAKQLGAAVKWYRDADGQTGWWTPKGASFKPHYFKKTKEPAMSPDALVSLRKSAGISQTQLADKLDVSLRTVASWEGGEQPITQLQSIALTAVLKK
ncbi:MAG: helix-turn-helix transcriptional regulator [Magnetococcales bacterium]|nr:helix-turn-helix transcriptional regulator [Magnetococcales bacterium]